MSKSLTIDEIRERYLKDDEFRKGWDKFIEFLRDNPELVYNIENTLKDQICMGIMCEMLNVLGVKNAYQIESAIENLKIDVDKIPEIDEGGELIEVIWLKNKFKIIIKNKKGKNKAYFCPGNVVKQRPQNPH